MKAPELILGDDFVTFGLSGWLHDQARAIRKRLTTIRKAQIVTVQLAQSVIANTATPHLLGGHDVLLKGIHDGAIYLQKSDAADSLDDMIEQSYARTSSAVEHRPQDELQKWTKLIREHIDPSQIIAVPQDEIEEVQTRMAATILNLLPGYLNLSKKVGAALLFDFVREYEKRGTVYPTWWVNQARKSHNPRHQKSFIKIGNSIHVLSRSKAGRLPLVGSMIAAPTNCTPLNEDQLFRIRKACPYELSVPPYIKRAAEDEGIRFGVDALSTAAEQTEVNQIEQPPDPIHIIVILRRRLGKLYIERVVDGVSKKPKWGNRRDIEVIIRDSRYDFVIVDEDEKIFFRPNRIQKPDEKPTELLINRMKPQEAGMFFLGMKNFWGITTFKEIIAFLTIKRKYTPEDGIFRAKNDLNKSLGGKRKAKKSKGNDSGDESQSICERLFGQPRTAIVQGRKVKYYRGAQRSVNWCWVHIDPDITHSPLYSRALQTR